MSHIAPMITDLALILVVAGTTTLLCKKLKQPSVIGYILAGFLAGPVVSFIPTVGDMANIVLWGDIGVIFLMFSLGLEFSIHKLAKMGSTSVVAAAVQVLGMLALGYIIGALLGWSTMNSVFLGGMLSMSSTVITVKSIEDLGLKQRKFTNIAMGTLIVEDVAAIFMMVVLSTIAVSQGGEGSLFFTLGKLVFYLVAWFVLGIFILPSLLKRAKNLMNDETLLIVSLGICFIMVYLAGLMGFSSALGAFMAGSILAGTVLVHKIEKIVTPCKDLFGAVFFISVGFLVTPATLVQYLGPVILLIIVTVLGKTLLLTASMLVSGQDLNTSLHAALAQTQVGEFSFIIASMGLSLGVTGDFLYPIIVAVAVITTLTTPFFIRRAQGFNDFLEAKLPAARLERLKKYSEGRQQAGRDDKDWPVFLKRFFVTMLIYCSLILGVIVLAVNFALPAATELLADISAQAMVCLAVYFLILPLTVPLLIFRSRYFTVLWVRSRANRLPLILLMAFRSATAVMLLLLPLVMIYQLRSFWLLPIGLAAGAAISRSHWLRGRYLQLEAKFLSNLNELRLDEYVEKQGSTAFNDWLDQRLYVGEFICNDGSTVSGKNLIELAWGQTFNVNVIKIIRNKKQINIPKGSEVVQAGDKLIVVGGDQALQAFAVFGQRKAGLSRIQAEQVTLRSYIHEQDEDKNQLLCYTILVEKDSPLANNSIRDSEMKTELQCYLIGLERDAYPIINPSPSMVLRPGDMVWILGTQQMGSRLLEDDLVNQ